MNKISFLPEAWEQYVYWQTQDRKTLKRINILLQDVLRNNYSGLGKPEPLSGNLSGWWSRRIDDANRVIYRIENDNIIIAQCKSHYSPASKQIF